MNKKEVSKAAKTFASSGGTATFKKYGPDHFRDLARLAVAKREANKKLKKNAERKSPLVSGGK